MPFMTLLLIALAACKPSEAPLDTSEPAPQTVPWSGELPSLDAELGKIRGLTPQRSIIHLHSPWSHDACDGDPNPEGQVNEPCLQDLRDALCRTRVDNAFVTDHPTLAAFQDYEDLFHQRQGDEWVDVGGAHRANLIHCENGHDVLYMPGIEDELMPVSLDSHVAATPDENDRIYNNSDAESMGGLLASGAAVLMAHTEGRDLAHLENMQDLGLTGIEIFNLHAMFAPDIRADDLGLDGFGWITDIQPFTSPDATGEPDLMVLGVLQDQPPSLEKWDALLQRGPMTGVGGTDAHQNVIPLDLRDDERGDSYRRMLRWFSNVLLVDGEGPDAAQAAIEASRLYVAFEILGTPKGFDLYLDDGSTKHEMGSSPASGGTLHVGCPEVSPSSPQGLMAPEILVEVYKNGVVWQTECGDFETDGDGVYRVQVDIIAHHLYDFFGEDPEAWLKPFPWIRSNAIRVGL